MRLFYFFTLLAFFCGCSKSDPVNNLVPNFSFTTSGGQCSGAVIQGNYQVGSPLDISNNVRISVNATAASNFYIHSDTLNGLYFSATGVFSSLGIQFVTLTGNGTPLSAGNYVYTLKGENDSCSFTVTVLPVVVPTGSMTCKINGVFYDFSSNMFNSLIYNPGINFKVNGNWVSNSNYSFSVWIQHPSITLLTPGTYSVNSAGFYVKGQYTDPSYNYWIGDRDNAGQSNPFTVVITSVTSSSVTGTFSGRIRENAGTGPSFKDVTEGQFIMYY